MLIIESVQPLVYAESTPSAPPFVMDVVVIGPQQDKGYITLGDSDPVPGGTPPGTIIFRSPDL